MQMMMQGPSEEEEAREAENREEKRGDSEVCTTPAQVLLYCPSHSVDDGSEENCITPVPLPHLDASHCVSPVCICFVFNDALFILLCCCLYLFFHHIGCSHSFLLSSLYYYSFFFFVFLSSQ